MKFPKSLTIAQFNLNSLSTCRSAKICSELVTASENLSSLNKASDPVGSSISASAAAMAALMSQSVDLASSIVTLQENSVSVQSKVRRLSFKSNL